MENPHEVVPPAAKVLILDAGSQYQKLIDRRVRELGVRCDIAPLDAPSEVLEQYEAFIISGGPASVDDDDAPEYNPAIFELEKPILGICYGQQLVTQHFGGKVGQHDSGREDGKTHIAVQPDTPLFEGMQPEQRVIMSHGDSVLELPDGFVATAHSGGGSVVAGLYSEERRIVGTQFHPEVTHTEHGSDMMSNFLFGVAQLEADYTTDSKVQTSIDYIQQTVGDKNVLCYVSGGLDSSVSAELLRRADLPGDIRFVLVDSGLLREGEADEVVKSYEDMGLEIEVLNERELFANKTTKLRSGRQSGTLAQETHPQTLRQIAGDAFADVRPKYLSSIGWEEDNTVLMMGTLRTDLIESGSAIASVNADEEGIKIHHNDTDEIRSLRERGLVVEPLQELHKDEVRAVGRELGMPRQILHRQPSPGPSGAVRVIAQKTPFRIAATQKEPYPPTLEQIDEQLNDFRSEAHDVGLFVAGLSTVGVQGDRRTDRHLLLASTDAQEPDFAHIKDLADSIPRTVTGISRLAFVSGSKLDGLVPDGNDGYLNDAITSTLVDSEGLNAWREIDAVARQVLHKHGLGDTLVVSQIPIMLSALNFGVAGERMAAVRPFMTEDYMTGEAAVPGSEDFPIQAFHDLIAELTKVKGIGRVAFDLSDKPPGTTEWK